LRCQICCEQKAAFFTPFFFFWDMGLHANQTRAPSTR
jgi:hypothetical protein